MEWAEPEQSQDVEVLRQKEEQLNGFYLSLLNLKTQIEIIKFFSLFIAPISKRLKKSKIIEDLGRDDMFDGKMDHTT